MFRNFPVSNPPPLRGGNDYWMKSDNAMTDEKPKDLGSEFIMLSQTFLGDTNLDIINISKMIKSPKSSWYSF